MVRRISTATAVSEVWDSHQDDDSDGTSGEHSQARRQSITESETSKQSNQESQPEAEVQSTKSLKQVTWLQEQNLEENRADDIKEWNKEQLDVELNRCAALTSEACASSPQAGGQSMRSQETSVTGEVDADMSKEDLEDAVKRCTKIAELLNQRLREQEDSKCSEKVQVQLPEQFARSADQHDARPDKQDIEDTHAEQEAGRGRPRSLPPRRGAGAQQRRAVSANPLERGWLQVEEELSPRAMRGIPNQKSLISWSVEDVYRWTLQVASCPLDVAERLRHQAVNGLVLASLTEQDLENMGIEKFGWRRQLVLLARCLQDKVPMQQAQAFQPLQAPLVMPPQRRMEGAMPFHSGMMLPAKHGQARVLPPAFWPTVTRSTLPAHFKPLWQGKSQTLMVARQPGVPLQRAVVEAPNGLQVPVYPA